ncbi:MAG: hypothetical protein R3C56_22565 [Pirellulaceae bacterium]
MLRTSSIRRRQLLRAAGQALPAIGNRDGRIFAGGYPLFLIVMGSIEFGRGMMVVQAMEEAALRLPHGDAQRPNGDDSPSRGTALNDTYRAWVAIRP